MSALSIAFTSARPRAGAPELRLLGRRRSFYLYIAPATLLFLAFVLYPIGSVLVSSFATHDVVTVGDGLFGNYEAVFADPVFWIAARNMVVWAVLTIFVQMVIGGTLAYLIEQHARRSRALLRTAFLIPMVTSASVVAIVWAQFYAPMYGPMGELFRLIREGLSPLAAVLAPAWMVLAPLGDALRGAGITGGNWFKAGNSLLGSADTAIYAIIIINIWMYTGFSMLLYIVGLHRISSEILDAARADGATGLRLARHILIPMLAPTTKSLLLLGIIGGLQTFALVFLTTKGGPNNASEVFGTQIFREAFVQNHGGFAAALSVITLLVAFVATVIQLRILRTGLSPTGRSG